MFKCSDVHNFAKICKLPINLFELNFYQNQIKWKHKLVPIEIYKTDSDEVSDLIFYKGHYVLIKKLGVFLGNQNCIFICRICLNSFTCQNMLIKHKENTGQRQEITSIRTSDGSHFYWKNHFYRNSLYFGIYCGF